MANNIKKYILTALTLGLIAASGALLIAATNKLTKDKIIQNEQNKINNGILSLYEDYPNPSIGNDTDLSNQDFKYINHIYYIYTSSDARVDPAGYAFRTTGSNMYGKISLIIGYTYEKAFLGLSIITNEQTYASTLVDNYINPLNEGNRELEDVSCGATYGAKLVRDMVNEANEVIKMVPRE